MHTFLNGYEQKGYKWMRVCFPPRKLKMNWNQKWQDKSKCSKAFSFGRNSTGMTLFKKKSWLSLEFYVLLKQRGEGTHTPLVHSWVAPIRRAPQAAYCHLLLTFILVGVETRLDEHITFRRAEVGFTTSGVHSLSARTTVLTPSQSVPALIWII